MCSQNPLLCFVSVLFARGRKLVTVVRGEAAAMAIAAGEPTAGRDEITPSHSFQKLSSQIERDDITTTAPWNRQNTTAVRSISATRI